MNCANYAEMEILGFRVTLLTEGQFINEIGRIIKEDRKELVLNVNINAINIGIKNPWMKDLINRSSMVYCDSAGVMWGARMLGYKIPERITCADYLWPLSEYCEREGYSIFFLGSKEGVADEAVGRLREKCPKLKVAGIDSGYFDREGVENDKIIEEINSSGANILLLGLGMPLQEEWLRDNWEKIDANVAINIGACFEFVSGQVKRAPRWMRERSLEWFFRFILEPKRMFYRYVVGNPLFIFRVMVERIKRGWVQ
jgi:N-acetylglucosaminyldiphosphoundecaprenol N-acetyl-beta-D-mannosaminyltransferase